MPDHLDEGATNGRLLDEVEQLRTALETALEENGRLIEDRDRLLHRVALLSQELRISDASVASEPAQQGSAIPAVRERQSHAEEELRVAFEELQVLTEELEVANNSLHYTNQELDARVDERTRQIREINATLRSAEGSLRTIADLVPDLLWRNDAHGDANWFNQRWLQYTGQTLDEALGKRWIDAIHPLDRDAANIDTVRARASDVPREQQQRIRDAQGNYRWFLIRSEPMRDEQDRVTAWFTAATDIHEQRTALEALQQSELRFRTILEGMPQLVWRAVNGGKWTWASPQWTRYTGQNEKSSHVLGWLDMFHPDDRDHAMAAWGCAGEQGFLEIEGRIFQAAKGRYRHFRTRALPVRDADNRVLEWLGTSTDVDDILQLQTRQEVLVLELQHRTRNLMAVVRAITKRTLNGSRSLEEFAKCIEDRFDALAHVQGLLSRRSGAMQVTFDVLVREEMSAHVTLDADGRSDQVTLAGPSGVPLKSSLVQTLALALHELATNAVKHGALSQSGGHLDIVWNVREPTPGDQRLFVDWRERGVSGMPDRLAERPAGFGRELIQRALPYQLGARTTYDFEPGGIHCTIDVSVPSEHS